MSLKHLTCPSKTLAASINSSATSFRLNNIKGWDDVDLTSADFGSQAFAVIRNANNTLLELIEFDPTTIASSSITIVRRGLKFTGDLTTEVAANKRSWTKGDTFVDIGVDTPQMYQWLQEYVDAAIVAGGVPATTSVLGLVKTATAPADPANPIVVGTNDPRIPTTDENNAMAGGGNFGTPSSSNKFVTETGFNTIESFGDGSDGEADMDGTNTFSFASKSGNIYTLTANIEVENLTVGSGVTLNTDGYIIKVRNTINGSGTIRHSDPATGTGGNGGAGQGGGSGSGGGGGSGSGGGIVLIYAAVWAGTFTIESIGSSGGNGGDESGGSGAGSGGTAGAQRGSGIFKGPAGKIGAAGVTATKVGTAGTAGDSVAVCISNNSGALGGTGRRTINDNVSGGAGGAGGTGTLPTTNINAARFLVWLFLAIKSDGTLTSPISLPGSGSGGSGGSDTSPNQSAAGGGGGGGNGGHAVVVFKKKTWTGTSSFTGGSGGTVGSGGEAYDTHDGANGATGSLIEFNWSQIG